MPLFAPLMPLFGLKLKDMKSTTKSSANTTGIWFYMVNRDEGHVFPYVHTISALFRTNKWLFLAFSSPFLGLKSRYKVGSGGHIRNQVEIWVSYDSIWSSVMNDVYFITFLPFSRIFRGENGSFCPVDTSFWPKIEIQAMLQIKWTYDWSMIHYGQTRWGTCISSCVHHFHIF